MVSDLWRAHRLEEAVDSLVNRSLDPAYLRFIVNWAKLLAGRIRLSFYANAA